MFVTVLFMNITDNNFIYSYQVVKMPDTGRRKRRCRKYTDSCREKRNEIMPGYAGNNSADCLLRGDKHLMLSGGLMGINLLRGNSSWCVNCGGCERGFRIGKSILGRKKRMSVHTGGAHSKEKHTYYKYVRNSFLQMPEIHIKLPFMKVVDTTIILSCFAVFKEMGNVLGKEMVKKSCGMIKYHMEMQRLYMGFEIGMWYYIKAE